MKVIRVLQIVDHLNVSCGVSSVVMNWYRNIDRRKVQFDFLVNSKTDNSYEDEILSLGGNIYYVQDKFSIKQLPLFIKNIIRFMANTKGKYSIAHIHSPTFVWAYFFFAKLFGIHTRIVHSHSVSYANSRMKTFRNYLLLLPMPYLATHYIACSKVAGNFLFGKRKFEIVTNCVDFEKFKFSKEKRVCIRKEWGYENNIVIGHISNMTDLKRVDRVIDVFNYLVNDNPQYRLVLIGKNELPQEIQEKICQYNIQKYIKNIGVTERVVDMMCGMDVCYMPSEAEGLGLVAVECQAVSLPVVVSEGFPDDVFVSSFIQKSENKEKIEDTAATIIKVLNTDKNMDNYDLIKNKYNISLAADYMQRYYLEKNEGNK